jgi:hypothetical protein
VARKVISGQAGRYDEVGEQLLRDLKADGIVLIVMGGRLGQGMSCAVDPNKPGGRELAMGFTMPELLESIAAMIRLGIEQSHGPDGIVVTEKGDN